MFRKKSLVPALAGVFAFSLACAAGANLPQDEEAANARIRPLARVELASSKPAVAPGARTGEDLYKAACTACHAAGVAGAPKLGDKAAWAPRLALGLDGLVKSATAGKNAMPPKGGAADATEAELGRAIAFIANQSGASFKEPK